MLTKGRYELDISNSFNNAISSISQRVKPLILIDWLDSRHVDKSGNTEIASSNYTNALKTDQETSNTASGLLHGGRSLTTREILFNKSRNRNFYFTPNESINGIERQSFTWGVCDAKDVNGKTITANGQWHCMPTTKDEHYEFGYESSVKSTSSLHATLNGYELSSPVILTYLFTERKVNIIKIVTSEYNGQICAYNIKAYHDTNTLVYNEDGEIPEDSYYFNHYLENIDNDNINKILLTVYTTKNSEDYVRVNEVSPIYRVDITDYIINFNVSKVRDVHETSLPIAGGGSNTASLSLDNSGKDFNLFNSASLYGKYMKKDLRCFIFAGWEREQHSSDQIVTTLSSNLAAGSNSISVFSINDFPDGGVGDDYVLTINSGTTTQERVLARKGVGNTFTVVQRGIGDTKARNHAAGSTVSYDIFEYVPFGVFYVDEWQATSSSMTVSANLTGWSKFGQDKTITKGFLLQETTVAEAVENLLLMTNFPRKDINYLINPDNFYPKNNAVIHLNFNEKNVDRANNSRTVSSSLRARLYKVPEDGNPRDIRLDILDKYLSTYEKALDIRTSVAPSKNTTSKEISDQSGESKAVNWISGEFTDKDGVVVDAFFNGVFDGYYIPSNTGEQRLIVGINKGGVRVYLNETKIIDEWRFVDSGTNTPESFSSDIYELTAGQVYSLKIEFFAEEKITNEPFKIFLKKEYSSFIDWVYSHECYTMVAGDNYGNRTLDSYLTFASNTWTPTANVNIIERSGRQNNGILLANAKISEPSGVVSDENSRSVLLESNAYIRIPYHQSFDVFNSNSIAYTGEFTIELYAKMHNGSFSNTGEYISSFNNSSPTSGFEFYSNSSSNGFKIVTSSGVETISSNTVLSNTNFSLVTVTYSDNVLKYFINGDLKNTVTTAGSLVSFANKDITIGGRGASFTAETEEAYAVENAPLVVRSFYIDEFAIANIAFDDEMVTNSYVQTQMQPIQIMPFIYGNDQTIGQVIDDISLSDFGRLYFDEYNKARYEHFNRFFESSINQHANVQYTLSDSSNIIDASYSVQLQTNKVTVKTQGVTNNIISKQGLWRAEDPTTVAVVSLTGSMSNSDTSMTVTSTNDPFFPKTGYLMIDSEIIKYGNTTSNSFISLERAQFDTAAAAHNSNTIVREVKVYDKLTFDKAPAYMIEQPLITNITTVKPPKLELIRYNPTPYGAVLIIAASNNNTAGDIIYLEGDNPLTEEKHFTSIAGIPVVITDNTGDVKEQKVTLDDNIRRYGLKEIIIENPFITNLDHAKRLANFIINKMSDPVPVLNLNILTVPKLQLGDRIRISTMDSFDIINGDYWVISSEFSYDKSLSQSVIIRKVV
ncbi:MAG: Concanavalin A-like lectin/glucanase superfamily [Pseudomonadota bacterium]